MIRAEIREALDTRARISREQRRYEIARDCMASAYNNPALFTDMDTRVEHAVKAADALLAELERTDADG